MHPLREKYHKPAECPFVTAKCHFCEKIGHIQSACLAKKNARKHKPAFNKNNDRLHQLEQPALVKEYDLFHMKSKCPVAAPDAMKLDFKVNEHILSMEIDTGAAFSLISASKFREISSNWQPLESADISLKTFTGESVDVLGKVNVHVQVKGQEADLPLLVVKPDGPNICGRNWIQDLNLLTSRVNQLNPGTQSKLEGLLNQYSDIFEPSLGLVKGVKAHIALRPDAKPRFCKARSVPFALRHKVDAEMDRLQEEEGIISPVQISDWVAPIVPVLKADGSSVRICGDFKQTINSQTDVEQYHIPKVEDIFAQLAGGKRFTRLDLRDAYNQVELDEETLWLPSCKRVLVFSRIYLCCVLVNNVFRATSFLNTRIQQTQ